MQGIQQKISEKIPANRIPGGGAAKSGQKG
jgi:hypothetical protein